MREYIKTFLLIFLTCFGVVNAQANNQYIAKYNIKKIDLNTLRRYFDSGIGWQQTAQGNPSGTMTITYTIVDVQKYVQFLKAEASIKEEIQRRFDSALDKCLLRIGSIQNENSSLSAACIQTALRTYIQKLKFDQQRNSQKSVEIKIDFSDDYKKYFNLNSSIVEREVTVNGQRIRLKFGTRSINDWDSDKQVDAQTNGQGTITIFNGYKDFKARFYRTTYRNCLYEWYCNYCRDQAFLNALSAHWAFVSFVVGSFEGLLSHEVIHNALRQETTESYWNGATDGRWGDDATVEDIQLKLFPRTSSETEAPGLNSYESTFHFAAWWYRVSKDANLPSNEWTRFFEYYPGHVQRKYNPAYIKGRCELKYKSGSGIRIIRRIKGHNYRVADETLCDDCRCEELERYVAPYFDCCGQGKMHVLK
jgi:hypothetical protein